MDVNSIFHFLALVAIAWLAYSAINMMSETFKKRKFVIKSYLKEDGQKKTSVFERSISYRKYKEQLQNQLDEAHFNKSVETFIAQRLLIAVSFLFLSLVLYYTSDKILFLYLAVPLAIVAYSMPKRQLKKRKEHYEQQLKNQLPDYLYHFAVLLENHTPFEATQKSVAYAGDLLKPHVNQLIAQITLYPTSHKPYYDFAEAVRLREAKEFMTALEQVMKVDAATSAEIIENQIRIMDELQEEAYNEQIETYPDRVDPYVNLMLMPFILIIIATIGVLAFDSLSGL